MMRVPSLIVVGSLLALPAGRASDYYPPGGKLPAMSRQIGSEALLPGGRRLRPLAFRGYIVGAEPRALAVSPSARFIVTADSGPGEFGLSVLTHLLRPYRLPRPLRSSKSKRCPVEPAPWTAAYTSLVFAGPDLLYASEGNSGRVRLVHLPDARTKAVIDLNTSGYGDTYSAALAYDGARSLLYVVDPANYRLVIIDAARNVVLSSVKVGRLPFALALSPNGERAYVTNLGTYDYEVSAGPGALVPALLAVAPPAPPDNRSHSLSVIDVRDPRSPGAPTFIPTGTPIGRGIVGGSSPSAVFADERRIYVANAHNDSITVLDAQTLTRLADIEIRIPGLETLRGITPVALAFHPRTRLLLVAEAGINAVGVIDTRRGAVVGHLPSGRAPRAIVVHDNEVYVLSSENLGENAYRLYAYSDPCRDVRRGFVHAFGLNYKGLRLLPRDVYDGPSEQAPPDEIRPAEPTDPWPPLPRHLENSIREMTRLVYRLNGFDLHAETPPPRPSSVRHVVLIVKENRSFDEVLGDMPPAGNGPVRAVIDHARFGMYGRAAEPGQEGRAFALRNVPVTPNLHMLARRWTLNDNFYSNAVVDVDGHHWLAGASPDAWALATGPAAYSGEMDARPGSAAPGRQLFPQGATAVIPEQYPEAGTLWHHLARNQVSFLSFGEGITLPGALPDDNTLGLGFRFFTRVPLPEPLWRNTAREYPPRHAGVSDQERAERFIQEMRRRFERGGEPLPRLLIVSLPGDHGAGPRGDARYPYDASYVADNDYALGRIVEYLSRSPWWREMAVFITEDDSNGGVDHVHGQRAPLLIVGPAARRNYISHTNADFPSLLKTIFRMLDVPPLNLFDATASNLVECFRQQGDATPYRAVPPDSRIFDPGRPRRPPLSEAPRRERLRRAQG